MLVVAAITIGVGVAFFIFYQSNENRITTQNETYLEDLASQRASLVDTLFVENLRYIESAAKSFEADLVIDDVAVDKLNVPSDSKMDDEEIGKIATILKEYEDGFAFDYFRFIDLHGRDYTTGDETIAAIVTERDYYKNGIKGQSGMTYVLGSKVTNERQIGFYSPVHKNDEVIGVVVGFYGEKFIDELLKVSMFGYKCEALICDGDGTVIYSNFKGQDYANFLDNLENLSLATAKDKKDIIQAFANGENTQYTYTVDNKKTVGDVAYIGDTSGLYLVQRFPVNAFQSMLSKSNRNGIMLLAMLIALFALAGIYYGMRSILQRRRLLAETKNSNDIHFAMSRLFENFVIVNADSGTYHYIEGMPDVGHIPNDGKYELFAEDLLERFPDEKEREESRDLISLDHLLGEMNKGANIISYNLHAPIQEEEWFTYNFIVVSRDQEGKVKEFIVARQDITRLQEKEQEIREVLEHARDEAEKGNRAKSNFLSSMSHDIRTPMNAIIGYTNIAREKIDDPEMVRESLNKISSSSKYLLSLINDVLDMSKIESGKLQINEEECDLRVIFERIADLTRSQASKKQLDISYDIESIEQPYIIGDELRLEQILINITSNAVKYTPDGGSIFISAREQESSGDVHRYEFKVKDTGIGMSEDYLPHIFESFSREMTSTINSVQGTGLGMAITARLVKLMGGTISVDSALGKGSEFTVTMDLQTVDKVEESLQGNQTSIQADLELDGKRILWVEDNDINAEIAKLVLSGYGLEVDRTVNGQEGVEAITEKGDDYYDAVLMDIQMPVMNGYDATREIRKLPGNYARTLPIIAMSANAYEEDIRDAFDAGMNGHIAKPFDPQDLANELNSQINRNGDRESR